MEYGNNIGMGLNMYAIDEELSSSEIILNDIIRWSMDTTFG